MSYMKFIFICFFILASCGKDSQDILDFELPVDSEVDEVVEQEPEVIVIENEPIIGNVYFKYDDVYFFENSSRVEVEESFFIYFGLDLMIENADASLGDFPFLEFSAVERRSDHFYVLASDILYKKSYNIKQDVNGKLINGKRLTVLTIQVEYDKMVIEIKIYENFEAKEPYYKKRIESI